MTQPKKIKTVRGNVMPLAWMFFFIFIILGAWINTLNAGGEGTLISILFFILAFYTINKARSIKK